MTLPNKKVMQMLENEFVLGAANIERAEFVGTSHGYRTTDCAVGTTNGAGGRNVQLCVLAADSTVLHVLPGFWHAEDLIDELEFSKELNALYLDPDRSRAEKQRLFQAMHRSKIRRISAETRARSRWQGFDVWAEVARAQREGGSDTVRLDEEGKPVRTAGGQIAIRPVCELVHHRMAQRPFLAFDDFDIEEFVDYGRPYYDNNARHDDGKTFRAAERNQKKRMRAEQKQRELELREQKRKARGGKAARRW